MMKSWKWLSSCPNIQQSLCELDLSVNDLHRFPRALIKLRQLVTLKLNHNQLERLPFGIRRMHRLRYLHLSSNKLISLPSTFNNLHLDTLDIWENAFKPQIEYNITYYPLLIDEIDNRQVSKKRKCSTECMESTPLPLWQLTCNVVDRLKLNHSIIDSMLPWDINELLEEGAQCACGRYCFDTKLYERAAPVTFDNIRNLVFSRDRLIYVDMVLCGANCLGHRQIMATT